MTLSRDWITTLMELTLPYTSLSAVSPKIRRRQYQYSLLVACVYFFFNSFMLPDGLLYTILLSPVFLYWLVVKKAPVRRCIFIFLLCWLPMLVIHYAYGI